MQDFIAFMTLMQVFSTIHNASYSCIKELSYLLCAEFNLDIVNESVKASLNYFRNKLKYNNV